MGKAMRYGFLMLWGLGAAALVFGQTGSSPGHPMPAATFSQFECSGFISAQPLASTLRVYNGADDGLYEILHVFNPGDYVYLRSSGGARMVVGQSYSLVRPENGFGLDPVWFPGMLENEILPPASRYALQRRNIKSLGRPYENTGIVRVVKLTPQGAIAKVVFSCNGVNAQDIAVPYVAQPVPEYVPATHLSRFSLPDGKLQGVIVGASSAAALLAQGDMAFLNVGVNHDVRPGQRFRIFAVFRYNLPEDLAGSKQRGRTPRETVGELIILHVEEKSSVGIIVTSLREIDIGDGVELE